MRRRSECPSERHFTHEIALLEFLLRKLGLLSVNVENDPQTAFHQHIERGGRSLSREPFSWLEPHIGDSLRQSIRGAATLTRDSALPAIVAFHIHPHSSHCAAFDHLNCAQTLPASRYCLIRSIRPSSSR
jgi:hypothetical protein